MCTKISICFILCSILRASNNKYFLNDNQFCLRSVFLTVMDPVKVCCMHTGKMLFWNAKNVLVQKQDLGFFNIGWSFQIGSGKLNKFLNLKVTIEPAMLGD